MHSPYCPSEFSSRMKLRLPIATAAAVAAAKSLQSCLTLRPHRRQPTRLLCPWDSPGKNTGVGCRFLLQCMKVKSESEVAQSCPTLCDPMDCSLPASSVHGIFQARVLEWGTIAFSTHSNYLRANFLLRSCPHHLGASLVAQSVKNLPAMQKTQVQSLGQEDPLEKEMATCSGILAWRIPWTENPGGLQSMGLQELDTTEWLNHHLTILLPHWCVLVSPAK